MARGPAAGAFPPGSVLLSRAWWFVRAHPVPTIALGLGGSAPVAALVLLFVQEAIETFLVPDGSVRALRPVASGIAVAWMVRYVFRLALARWMWRAAEGRGSLPSALGWAVTHLPTALFYGAWSTLGWMTGAVLFFPIYGTLHANLAFHAFASGDRDAIATLREAARLPLGRSGMGLLAMGQIVFLVLFLLLWTVPGSLLGLAEWLLRADVAAAREVVGYASVLWGAVAFVGACSATGLLWSVAHGLLWEEWTAVSRGRDLDRDLARLERRLAEAA